MKRNWRMESGEARHALDAERARAQKLLRPFEAQSFDVLAKGAAFADLEPLREIVLLKAGHARHPSPRQPLTQVLANVNERAPKTAFLSRPGGSKQRELDVPHQASIRVAQLGDRSRIRRVPIHCTPKL